MEKIKLVIWDLDDTFWKGTLSEGEVQPIKKNIELIKILSERGIINSISSKNDFNSAKQKLEEYGIWDYFVFPSIEWTPKGQNISNIIDKCQLRAVNVLFIDDNPTNLREAEHYNSGINTLTPDNIVSLLELDSLKGKNDKDLSRLKQYKILEVKDKSRRGFSNNHDFLLESNITISIDANTQPYVDRISELVERTNQLNFTKVRHSTAEIETILNNPEYECRIIHVRDKYGDYGICGFYALKKKENALVHFVFSCRAMNLGIEQYVYLKLGLPNIKVVPQVASDLHQYSRVDWIVEDDSTLQFQKSELSLGGKKKIKILFLGGCDLEQLCHYISDDLFEVITDFNYPSEKFFPVHREHTVYLKEYENLDLKSKSNIYSLPFADENFFDMKFFKEDYDILVYSVLMNYTHEIYQHKTLGYKIAYGGYMDKQSLMSYLQLDSGSRKKFASEYEFIGLQTPSDFRRDIEWLIQKVKKPIYFLNGAEMNSISLNEPYAYERHKEMNKALEEVVALYPERCKIIDVRKYAKRLPDFKDTIRHYQRPVYMSLAEALMSNICEYSVRIPLRKKILDIYELLINRFKRVFRKIKKLIYV